MSDRAFLFLFSLAVVVAALGAAAWLAATHQVRTVDGLFLFSSCTVIALAFGLYLRWMIQSALREERKRPLSSNSEAHSRRTTSNAETTAVLSDVR